MKNWCISARGWEPAYDYEIGPILEKANIRYLETSPGKIFNEGKISISKAKAYRSFWADFGLEVIALQSLFFGQPQLKLFNGSTLFNEAVTYFKQLIELGEALGITHFVFGAYQSRLVGTLEKDVADDIFITFLSQVSGLLKGTTMNLLIEPVPKQYGADYLIDHQEILNVVSQTDKENIGLLLDLGAFYTIQESNLENYIPLAKHIHLAVPGFGRVDQCIDYPHLEYAGKINGVESAAISIEMFEHAFKLNPSTELKEMLTTLFEIYQVY